MNGYIIIALVWICISTLNFYVYIPDKEKQRISFVVFIGLPILSPIVSLIVYAEHFTSRFK